MNEWICSKAEKIDTAAHWIYMYLYCREWPSVTLLNFNFTASSVDHCRRSAIWLVHRGFRQVLGIVNSIGRGSRGHLRTHDISIGQIEITIFNRLFLTIVDRRTTKEFLITQDGQQLRCRFIGDVNLKVHWGTTYE